QPAAHQILVRRHTENIHEDAQKVERAQPRLVCRAVEINWLMSVRVDPQRRFDSAEAIARSRLRRIFRSPRDDLDKAGRQQQADFGEPKIAAARGGRLGEFAEDHQLGERWYAAGAQNPGVPAESLNQWRRELERQTFVAAVTIVRADIFIARMADED